MRVEKRSKDGKVETLLSRYVDLGGRTDALYSNLTEILDSIYSSFPPPDLVVVERQPPINYWTVRLSSHTICYCMVKGEATIVEVNPRTCFGILGRTTEAKKRKQWSVEWSESFLRERGDWYGASALRGEQDIGKRGSKGGIQRKGYKVDDIAITVCQIEAVLCEWSNPPSLTLSAEYDDRDRG